MCILSRERVRQCICCSGIPPGAITCLVGGAVTISGVEIIAVGQQYDEFHVLNVAVLTTFCKWFVVTQCSPAPGQTLLDVCGAIGLHLVQTGFYCVLIC